MNLEIARLAVVYAHLIACCVAIGLVITHDVAMVRQLLRGQSNSNGLALKWLHRIVTWSLAALWLSGLTIITLDWWMKGAEYFSNPKLQAKIAIACLLTMNGLLLHLYVLPAMQKVGSILHMSFRQSMLAIFAGTVSGVSWMYAAMLGLGRVLSWKYSLLQLTVAYPLLIFGSFFTMLLVVDWARHQYTRYAQFIQRVPAMIPAH